jgi:hypothetical protein
VSTNNEYLLRWVDVEYVSINGQPATNSADKHDLEPLKNFYLATPPMRISRGGEFLGVADLDLRKQLDRVDDLNDQMNLGRAESRTNANAPRYADLFDNPAGKKMYEQALSTYWTGWVEPWLGWDLRPGQSTSNLAGMTLGNGLEVPSVLLRDNLAGKTNPPGHVHLFYQEYVEGREFANFMNDLFTNSDFKTNSADKLLEIKWAARLVTVEAMTDPRSLVPLWSKRKTVLSMDVPGEGRVSQKEARYFEFLWWHTNGLTAATVKSE